jgi:hypothetical protein
MTHVGHTEHDEYDVYIGRRDGGDTTIQNAPPGDCFGNPYPLTDYSRESSVRKFAALLGTLLEERPIYRLHVRDLAGQTLGCWCRRVNEREPACHGDVLAARADQLHDQMVSGGGQSCERGDHWLVQYRQWRECVHCGISGQSLSSDRAIDRTGAELWPEDDEEPHRVSDVSDEKTETGKTGDSDSHNLVEDGSDDANPGFEAGEPAARKHPDHEQSRAAVASPQHAPDERGWKGGPR